jgi:hypothetical protein
MRAHALIYTNYGIKIILEYLPKRAMSQKPKTIATTRQLRIREQWAWEFLRRNVFYLEAWQTIAALTKSQRQHLSDYTTPNIMFDRERAVIDSLPARLFENPELEGQALAGDYFELKGKGLAALRRSELMVAAQYTPRTYCIKEWVDPASELGAKEASSIWFLDVPCTFGLVAADDDVATMMRNSPASFVYRAALKKDKRRKAKPSLASNIAPAVFGGNGTLYFSRQGYARQTVPVSIQSTEVAVVLRTDMPIRAQMKVVEGVLRSQQQRLIHSNLLPELPAGKNIRHVAYERYLNILDQLVKEKSTSEIALELEGAKSFVSADADGKLVKQYETDQGKDIEHMGKFSENARQQIGRAIDLASHGYKGLVFPDYLNGACVRVKSVRSTAENVTQK